MVLLQVNLVIRHNLALSRHHANPLNRGNLVSFTSQVNLFNQDSLHIQSTPLNNRFILCRDRKSVV